MIPIIRRWMARPWQSVNWHVYQIADAYVATFSTPHGQMVLQHLVDTVYCRIVETSDPQEAIALNAQRAVVQRILENIELGRNPSKATVTVENGQSEVSHGSVV